MFDHRSVNIRKSLGEPDFEIEGVMLYNRDCVEALRSLPDQTIDLTVTSPPYNIGKAYEEPMSTEEYVRWSGKWMIEVHRITAEGGAFWLNLGYVGVQARGKAVPLPYLLWDLTPFFLIQEIVWNYGAGVASRHSFSPRNEKFLWFVRNQDRYTFQLDAVRDPDVKYPNQKKNGKLKCNPLGKNPTDVWNFPKVTSGTDRSSSERTSHPAQFPIAVIDRIVKACSKDDDYVLEPFLGSGTTAEVALANGRNLVGFEIRPDYFQIAVNRLRSHVERREIAESQTFLPLR